MEYKYSWKYGSQEISDELTVEDYVPQSTGTLTLNVVDRLGCTAKSSAKVTVYDYPKVSIEGSRDVCKGSSTVLTAKVDKPNALQYAWNDNLSTTEASVKVSPAETQAYTVTVTYSDAKCVTKESATVNVVHYPQIACMDDQRMCEGDLATIAVSGQAEGYQWSSSDVSIDGNTGTQYEVSPDASTEYKVTAYNNDTLRCESTDAMMVYVMRKPTVIINYNPSVIDELTPQVVFADSTTGVTERLWRLGDGTESSDKQFLHTFDLDDTTRAYSVTLIGTTVDGCVDSANTEIAVQRDHHVWSPNAVYLHDNNVANRTFRVHIDQIQEFKLLVFNRWGEVVFESDDMEQAWDCTHKGKVVPQGVYTWVVQYRQTDSPKREKKTTGTVFIYN
ncbi:MAG: gliding motility-associated C-terminal domain-containing protein, partial [Bacteroidales bacterium]|nr:gliding motility-associated C-terminal domain-containing protein [Bacteroidales bacterium]